jgi:hypothetical protein
MAKYAFKSGVYWLFNNVKYNAVAGECIEQSEDHFQNEISW